MQVKANWQVFPLFQSTLPRGERHLVEQLEKAGFVFQSTLPRGERLQLPRSSNLYTSISIHAPARGATPRPNMQPQNLHSFQSTLPRGERLVSAINASDVGLVFQSTLPRGERPVTRGHFSKLKYFNPRSREGSDWKRTIRISDIRISIHAPARGATQPHPRGTHDHGISIHAPARGATIKTESARSFDRFQSTLPRGERR